MLVYQTVFFWDDHFLFDSPPTTNHQPQQPNCWLKKALLKKTPFFEAYTKAHKWRHLLENCPTPGNSWSAMHLVEKASAKSWLVLAGSPNTRNISFCKENSFRKSLFLTCTNTRWFKPWPNSIPPVGGHDSNFWVRLMEFHSPPKRSRTRRIGGSVFLVFFTNRLSLQSLSSVLAKGFFLQQLCHHTRFFPGEYTPRRRKNHSCTQPGRNNGATTGAPCWTSSGHIEKCWENPFFGWHPDKNPTPYNIYTFSTGHWVYMYSLLKGLQQEGLNS